MNTYAASNAKWLDLSRPAGAPIRLNDRDFVAVDRNRDATYDPIFRPQALYNVAKEGFVANNEAFLLQEVATDLPIYRADTGPTDFHLHLPPGGFQLVIVTSGVFTFDYDGKPCYVGPGAAVLQSAIVHRQLFYTWSGLSTEENLKTPQTVVPDSLSMGYSGKFLEAFITDPASFPNPTVVGPEHIDETVTPRTAWSHGLHDRPAGAGFWLQDAHSVGALYKPLSSDIVAPSTVYVRDLGIEAPSGRLATAHIIATDPQGRAVLPKSSTEIANAADLAKGEVAIHRVIRGEADFKDKAGKTLTLGVGDTVTAGRNALRLAKVGADTQILRIGLLKGIDALRKWTPTQRDEIDGLAGQIITSRDLRPVGGESAPVGYLYR